MFCSQFNTAMQQNTRACRSHISMRVTRSRLRKHAGYNEKKSNAVWKPPLKTLTTCRSQRPVQTLVSTTPSVRKLQEHLGDRTQKCVPTRHMDPKKRTHQLPKIHQMSAYPSLAHVTTDVWKCGENPSECHECRVRWGYWGYSGGILGAWMGWTYHKLPQDGSILFLACTDSVTADLGFHHAIETPCKFWISSMNGPSFFM